MSTHDENTTSPVATLEDPSKPPASAKLFKTWVPYDYHSALLEYAELGAEPAFVLLQARHLILAKSGPIPFDGKHIGRFCGMSEKKCTRFLNILIEKGYLCLTSDGKINCDLCQQMIEDVSIKREKFVKAGQKSAEMRKENSQNQLDNSNNVHSDDKLDTYKQNKNIKKIDKRIALPPDPSFDVEKHLTDQVRASIKRDLDGLDFQYVVKIFNEEVRTGKHPMPTNPAGAFTFYCRRPHQ